MTATKFNVGVYLSFFVLILRKSTIVSVLVQPDFLVIRMQSLLADQSVNRGKIFIFLVLFFCSCLYKTFYVQKKRIQYINKIKSVFSLTQCLYIYASVNVFAPPICTLYDCSSTAFEFRDFSLVHFVVSVYDDWTFHRLRPLSISGIVSYTQTVRWPQLYKASDSRLHNRQSIRGNAHAYIYVHITWRI